MRRILLTLLLITSPLAFAHSCPKVMKEIDAKITSSNGLSPEIMTKARQLRTEGERLHKEGKHDESIKALEEAKRLLGA